MLNLDLARATVARLFSNRAGPKRRGRKRLGTLLRAVDCGVCHHVSLLNREGLKPRPALTYRAARRLEAQRAGKAWRALPRLAALTKKGRVTVVVNPTMVLA